MTDEEYVTMNVSVEESLLSKEDQESVVKIFEQTDLEYDITEIIEELKKKEYANPGKIILDAIYDNILDVSSVDNDGSVYLALGMEGEDLWRDLNDVEDGNGETDEEV